MSGVSGSTRIRVRYAETDQMAVVYHGNYFTWFEVRRVELLRQVAAGDRTAFKELYLIYHRRLARFLMRMTSRHDLIEEVINDTLWTVWLKAGDFRGDSLVSTWIVGITYRRALKALRRHGTTRPMLIEEVAVAPDVQLEAENREWLGQALAELGEAPGR